MEKKSLLKNSGLQNALKLLCLIAAAAMWLIAVLVYGAPVPYMLIAAGFFVFYVLLPGLFLVSRAGFRGNHLSTDIALGIFAGWGFNVLLYFISDAIPGDILLYAGGPLLSLVYIYELYTKRQSPLVVKRFRFSKLPLSCCIFALIVMFYCMNSVQFHYMSPALADFTVMNSDKAYHLGLINSLSHDYPMQSPWVSNRYITYHIFSEVLLSIPVRLFSVPSDFMMLSFGPIFNTCTFSISLYSFLREMAGRADRAGVYCLLLILSNIYISRNETTSLAFRFVLENDNSSGYGIAAMLMTVVVFKKWYEAYSDKDPSRYRLCAALLASVMLLTGIKGPMGAVIAAALWGTVLLGIILRKVSPKTMIPLLIVTAGFVFIYKTILNGRGVSNATGSSIIAFATVSDIAFWKKPLIAAMQAAGIPVPLRLAVVLIVFVVFFLTIFFVPFCIGYVRELILVLSGRKPYEPHRVLVYAACAVGFILMLLLNYSGHSQVYFGFVTVFLAPLVAYWFIEDMEAGRDTSKAARYTLNITVTLMAATLVVTTITLTSYMSGLVGQAVKATNLHRTPDKYMSISNDEYDAMVWLNENTDNDALLAADRYYSVPLDKYAVDNRWDNRFFLYAVYSNRFTYITGSGYNIPDREYELRREMINTNKQLYDPENEDRGNLARELGVDYVIVSKRFTDVGDLSNKDYEKCYSNDDVDIYKIAG